MGRGSYDTTDAGKQHSSAAQAVINRYHDNQAKEERKAEAQRAIESHEKLIRSRKSRGILAARQEAKKKA